ncbi:MarR family winged helix-turn-helix transcriptional regulator [Pseudonocardia acaciae]|uniref:MarR family winged helix-turn-helix transcriptional regulator n=1 Tax=Pseudonocardia acaciae TaxID=551276 RepID=UPI0005695FD4|nr:MarR family transcriptional regulator [Pseudonocardia acaciae]
MEMAGAPGRLRRLPSWLITQTAVPAGRLVGEGLGAQRARRAHYSVLAALDEFGPASQAELSRRCGIYRSDLVALVNEMCGLGWVRRAPDHDDRRRNVITITRSGEHQLRLLDELLAGIQDELLAPLSPAEREQLVRLLTRVLEHHGGG